MNPIESPAMAQCKKCGGKGGFVRGRGSWAWCQCDDLDDDLLAFETTMRQIGEEVLNDSNPFKGDRGEAAWLAYRMGTLRGLDLAPPREDFRNPRSRRVIG